MSSGKILVVDDDSNLLEVIRMRLESADYEVVTAIKEEDAIAAAREQIFDIAIFDLQLADQDGISLMQDIHAINPDLPVIILTAYGSIGSTVEAMKKGAYNYLEKPFDGRDLLLQIETALENRRLAFEIRVLKGLLEESYDSTNIVAKSEKMKKVLGQISLIAGTDSTVFIHGESGTGKELIARAVHLGSKRKDEPFVAINCAAIPETLLESELFGYEKGSFTGAVQNTIGLFTQAHKGTIFLDEIANMALTVQNKILRVLQERQFYPVGSKKPIEVDVRVVVATNKDLKNEVKEGRFREDLFYRIHVIPIHLPPLREKKEDIPCLAVYFLERLNKKMKKEVKGLTHRAIQKLMLYDWPGNVRELENTIEYAMAMTQQDFITEDLILPLHELSTEALRNIKEAKNAFEKSYLQQLLELTKCDISKAAKLAGINRTYYHALIRKHKINIDAFNKA
jgi:two-component system response regulator GlrR